MFPTFFTLTGLTMLAIVAELVAYADLVVNRGFGFRDVAQIALLSTLPMVGRAIPYSMLLGALIALGRLAADREILAIQASGVSPLRLFAPVASFAAVLAVIAVWITAFVEPYVNDALADRIEESVRRSAGTALHSGVVTQIGEWRIVAREVSSHGDRMRGVAVWVPSLGQTVFAASASLGPAAPAGVKQIDLENGVVVKNGDDGPSYITFDRMSTALDAGGDSQMARAVDRLPRGTLRELARAIRSERDPRNRRAFEADWHRRLALPAATLCFGALAVPLALRPRRLSRSSGAVAGIAAMVGYIALLQLSNGLVQTESFPIGLAVWLPNLSLLAASGALAALPSGADARRWLWRTRGEPIRSRRTGRFVLAKYLLVRFLEIGSICFVSLLVALVLVDVVDNLQWFTKYRSTLDEVMRFYAARMPLLVSRVVPISLLVSAALTVSLFGVTGELIGMRACGIGAMRIVVPILVPCLVVALGYREAVDGLVPHAIARATQIKRVEIKAQQTQRLSFWSRDRDHLYQADRIDPLAGVAQGITIYELNAIGLPTSRTDADAARHVGEGTWHLREPRRVEVGPDGVRRVDADPLAKFGEEFATERDGAELSVAELRDEIDTLELRGFDATAYRVDLQAKLAAPLACLVLPALALLLATGGPPFRTPAQILLVSVALMFAHFGLSAFCVSLGYRGTVSALAAGWGATALYAAALSALVLARMRRSGAILRPR
ncbi:MAG TPA: LptF/LptG family permease [Myxococcota bacterium]|nr:LptF/LptG family permease [Myxococcota bacterium]